MQQTSNDIKVHALFTFRAGLSPCMALSLARSSLAFHPPSVCRLPFDATPAIIMCIYYTPALSLSSRKIIVASLRCRKWICRRAACYLWLCNVRFPWRGFHETDEATWVEGRVLFFIVPALCVRVIFTEDRSRIVAAFKGCSWECIHK